MEELYTGYETEDDQIYIEKKVDVNINEFGPAITNR